MMAGAMRSVGTLSLLVMALLVSGQVALAQSDFVARGLAARAAKDVEVKARVEKLKRAATRASVDNADVAPPATGVTMTVSPSADAALTKVYNAGTSASLLNSSGGKPTPAGGSGGMQYLYFPVASVAPAVNGNLGGVLTTNPDLNAWGWSASFVTDSDRVEVRLNSCSACLFRVKVDGRYVDKEGTSGLNFVAFVQLAFEDGRRPRTITVEASDTIGLRGIAVKADSNIWRAEVDADRIVVLASGDSYSEGQGARSPGLFAWPKVLGRLMGWSDVRQVAVGGTGYLNTGGALGRSKTSDQMRRWLTVNSDLKAADVDIVIMAAGYNDYGVIAGTSYSPEQIATEALVNWRAMRAMMPHAMLIVMGPHAGTRGPDGRTLAIEAALKQSFSKWRDHNALFVPIVGTDGSSPWIFGTGHVGAETGDGNADFAIGNDAIHPSDAGHALYAHRAAAAIKAALKAK